MFFGQKRHFSPKILIFTFLAKLIHFNPKIGNLHTKLNFKVSKRVVRVFSNQKLFKNFGNRKKCNFTDCDTSSALKINSSNTHRVSLPYGFAAIDCQN